MYLSRDSNCSFRGSNTIFLPVSLETGSAIHVRWTLELPGSLFNLLALGLFYIKLHFILYPVTFALAIISRSYTVSKRFLKNMSVMPSLIHCHVNKKPASKPAAGIKSSISLLNPGWWILKCSSFQSTPHFSSAFQQFVLNSLSFGSLWTSHIKFREALFILPQGNLHSSHT